MVKTSKTADASSNRGMRTLIRVAKYAGAGVAAVILICVVIVVFFADPLINTFAKDRIIKAFAEAYPEYSLKFGDLHYSVLKNRLGCDSILLKTRGFTCSVLSFSVGGIGWMNILRHQDFTPHTLASAELDAHNIVFHFRRSQEVLRLSMLHVSVPDSEVVIDSLKYYSVLHDEQFFANSRFRQTRFRFDIPGTKITGMDCLAMLYSNTYTARTVTHHGLFADILVNMDKPYDTNSPNPKMPNEALSSMEEIIAIGSLNVINGRLKYSERYAVNAAPGVITFDKINVSASGIANHQAHPGIAIIHGEGVFMNSGTMKVSMTIPLTPKDFSLHYDGSLSTMDVTRLNSFIEAGEHRRITSGVLQSATFATDVHSGRASGTLRLVYNDLSIAVMDKKTGSTKGIFDRISTLLGKLFVIRRTNTPNDKGAMKIGNTKYERQRDDYFLQFVWFSLRNGLADVVGFPPR